jgi:hypothetical protein
MKITYYDYHFNENEWFVLILLLCSYLLVVMLPKRFSMVETLVYIVLGIYIVNLCDHTISLDPFNLYDVNDNSSFEFFDFLSYIMFGPFCYFFLYIWDRLKIKGTYMFIYILIWTLVAIFAEWLANQVGLFHYRGSFNLYYSGIIYIFVQTITLGVYYSINYRLIKNL